MAFCGLLSTPSRRTGPLDALASPALSMALTSTVMMGFDTVKHDSAPPRKAAGKTCLLS
jgi:hypothetical protein